MDPHLGPVEAERLGRPDVLPARGPLTAPVLLVEAEASPPRGGRRAATHYSLIESAKRECGSKGLDL